MSALGYPLRLSRLLQHASPVTKADTASAIAPPGQPTLGERRTAPRQRSQEDGLIVVDEHTTLACMLYDRSDTGVRLTMLDARAVPDTFVLIARCLGVAHVCSVAWRSDETIGARLDRPTTW